MNKEQERIEKIPRAQNRHDKQKWKKKKHPASKCGNAKCLICHSDKLFNVPDRRTMRADSSPLNPTTNEQS